MEEVLQGAGVVAGIGIARIKAVVQDLTSHLAAYQAQPPAEEAARLTQAVKAAGAELSALQAAAANAGQDNQAAILEAHQAIVNDPGLAAHIYDQVAKGIPAPQAVLAAAEEFAGMFDAMPDPYLKERAADVRDIGRRVVRLLVGAGEVEYGAEPVVLCAEEIEPSLASGMPEEVVQGIVLGQGSSTSHTIIIAKARSIPAVTGLGQAVKRIADGTMAIVDGHTGQVILDPAPERLAEYQARLKQQAEQKHQDQQLAGLAAVTKSGTNLQLAANIGSPADMPAALRQGAQGVGLFRSEFLFLGRDIPPNEEEQFAAYKAVVEQCGNHLCVIRTMDIGGDKPLPYLTVNKEDNPFLGWRAIRISLERPELFITQLKAILRAGLYGRAAIMLPMIISVAEIQAARQCVAKAKAELEREGKHYAADIPLGIMMETPAAAVTARELAAECDFFSVGTNDLVQYTLAVDRGNPAVRPLYSHFHPAILRLLDNIVKAGHAQGIWVGMCGEMAGDPLAAPLLAALGFDELSMSAPAIPRVKEVIRRFEDQQMRQVLDQARSLADADQIRRLLVDFVG